MGKLKTTETFISEAQYIFGNKYTYTSTVYSGAFNKIQVYCTTCLKHITVVPHDFLKGHGCWECGIISRSLSKKQSKDAFVKKSQNIHRFMYNYDHVIMGSTNKTKVKILCNKCNTCFMQSPNDHIQGNGCPSCKKSKGEMAINTYLNNHDIPFKTQYCFSDCRNIRMLPFDFYIDTINTCIEYDGELHFKPWNTASEIALEKFLNIQLHDKIKTEYCQSNNIRLIRISYWDIDNIPTILNDLLFTDTDQE